LRKQQSLQHEPRFDIMEASIIVCLVFVIIIFIIGATALMQIGFSKDARERSMAVLPK